MLRIRGDAKEWCLSLTQDAQNDGAAKFLLAKNALMFTESISVYAGIKRKPHFDFGSQRRFPYWEGK